ncbi:MAG: NAD(+)/NADH kinase [Candidatus Hydrothermarchaeota archaeon]
MIKTIGIIAKRHKKASKIAKRLVKISLNRGLTPVLEESTAEMINRQDLGVPLEDIDADVIFTVGGDGTILLVERHLKKEIPICGINIGGVGFLTEISPENTEFALDNIIEGRYGIEERSKISLSIGGEPLPDALNEVVIMTFMPGKMLNLEVWVNGQLAESFGTDGIILATPTGSTAYAMSAGGPIIDPRVDAFVIVPICPFKLSARPLVVPSDSLVKVKITKPEMRSIVVVDGQYERKVKIETEFLIKKSKRKAHFIKFSEDFYEKVREKIG